MNGKYNSANIMVDELDEATREQIQKFLNHPAFSDSYISIMPDCHKGNGSCIGFTMTLNGYIIPNVIGVDIGCLDKDTEFLSPHGWKKISEYDGEDILQYDKNSATASFARPIRYIEAPCTEFFQLYAKNGLNQVISPEHKMLVWQGFKGQGYSIKDIIATDFVEHHNTLAKGIQGGVKTTFGIDSAELPISDIDIRIMLMVSADGRIRLNKDGTTLIELHFTKKRKIERARFLLKEACISYNESTWANGSVCLSFHGKDIYTKELSLFWKASARQCKIISEESVLWDGSHTTWGAPTFSTTIKANADVIQFAYAVTGIRCGINTVKQKNKGWSTSYQCYGTGNDIVCFPPRKIKSIPSVDGKKYCFTTSTGYFVIRRGDCISITGNCGMATAVYDIDPKDVDLPWLDRFIKQNIPSGFSIHNNDKSAYIDFPDLSQACGAIGYDTSKARRSLGTLGGGNHFIEAGVNRAGQFCITVHTGSRNFGKSIADFYQKAAIRGLERYLVTDIDKELAYIPIGSNLYSDYTASMRVAQLFAVHNRSIIFSILGDFLGSAYQEEYIESVHNFIDFEDRIIRKGATPAREGQKVIIPFNMRDGIAIGVGKGSKKYNYSAPHGAGRILSRTKAKAILDVDVFQQQMRDANVYTTTANKDTLDEAPGAYKDMQTILDNISETVDIVDFIKPIYNFKAGGD
jgi:RNA-splicing ligase RtcB